MRLIPGVIGNFGREFNLIQFQIQTLVVELTGLQAVSSSVLLGLFVICCCYPLNGVVLDIPTILIFPPLKFMITISVLLYYKTEASH